MTLNKHLIIQHDIIKIFMYKLELTVEQTKCNIKINWLSVSVKTRTIWSMIDLNVGFPCHKWQEFEILYLINY
jgi:hypothetical protein